MNLFRPYTTISDTATELHLAEPGLRRKFMFFFFRVMPFLTGALVLPVLDIEDLPEEFKIMLVVLTVIIFIVLLSKVYVTEVKVSRQFIEIRSNRFAKISNDVYMVSDIEKITVRVYGGKGGGFFYKLKTYPGKPVTFFTIPVLFMKMENLPLINHKLYELTGIRVERK